jgi:hypothetical protein
MKRTSRTGQLTVRRETLRSLSNRDLSRAAGGKPFAAASGGARGCLEPQPEHDIDSIVGACTGTVLTQPDLVLHFDPLFP